MEVQKVHIQATANIPRWGCLTASGELADSNTPAHEHHIIGLSDGAIVSGEWGDSILTGIAFDNSWTWTPGSMVYLNGTTLSQTPPGVGFVQTVGWALTPTSMLVRLG